MKASQGKKVEDKGMAWAKHYSDAGVGGIGTVELLALSSRWLAPF